MEEAYEKLANAIILQAVKDYRLTKDYRQREEFIKWFRSADFSRITDLNPEVLIAGLMEEELHG